jgi:glutamine cyclotransferase
MRIHAIILAAALSGPALAAQTKDVPPPASTAPKQGYVVVNSYAHDARAFTQGLEFFDGFLYEGTGLTGRSSVRKVELQTGRVVQEERLHPQYFGEGITISQGKLFQITWKDRTGFVYDVKTLKFIRNFAYFGEGWGLAHDPSGLILSDGTSTLRFLELTRFQERRKLKVLDGGVAIERLNELEYVRGEIWANVSETNFIARISPKDGRVLGWINLTGILSGPQVKLPPEAVLNGIAYDAQKNRIFVTGKLWPRIFEIQVK